MPRRLAHAAQTNLEKNCAILLARFRVAQIKSNVDRAKNATNADAELCCIDWGAPLLAEARLGQLYIALDLLLIVAKTRPRSPLKNIGFTAKDRTFETSR